MLQFYILKTSDDYYTITHVNEQTWESNVVNGLSFITPYDSMENARRVCKGLQQKGKEYYKRDIHIIEVTIKGEVCPH